MTPAEVLAALKETVAKMTPGPWSFNVCTAEYGARAARGPWREVMRPGSANERAYADAEGLVALRNYADALIEIAEAAVALNLPDEPGGWQPEFGAKAALRAALARLGKGE